MASAPDGAEPVGAEPAPDGAESTSLTIMIGDNKEVFYDQAAMSNIIGEIRVLLSLNHVKILTIIRHSLRVRNTRKDAPIVPNC